MKLFRKIIDHKEYIRIDLTVEDDLCRIIDLNIDSKYYLMNPPKKFWQTLNSIGFKEEGTLTLLALSKIDQFSLPQGYSLKKACRDDIYLLQGIGEENYPDFLKHDFSFYMQAINSTNQHLYIITDNLDLIVGKFIIETEDNICKLRAVGLKKQERGTGILKAVISYILNTDTKVKQCLVLCLDHSVIPFSKIGFEYLTKYQCFSRI